MLKSFGKCVCACSVCLEGIKCSRITFLTLMWITPVHSMLNPDESVDSHVSWLRDTCGCCASLLWWKQKLFALRKCTFHAWCRLPSRRSILDVHPFSPPLCFCRASHQTCICFPAPRSQSVIYCSRFVLLAWHDQLCQCSRGIGELSPVY